MSGKQSLKTSTAGIMENLNGQANDVTKQRLSLFPLAEGEQPIWDLYQTQEANSWGVAEVNLADDVKDYPHLTELQRRVFDITIARFVVADKPVVDNLACLADLTDTNDMVRRMMLDSQARIEGVHMHMYGLFITNIIPDPTKRAKLQQAVSNYPSIKAAVELVRKYQQKGQDDRIVLLSQACAEGIGFSTPFAIALYFKTLGKMYGFSYGNTKVMQDEHLHYEHACQWLSTYNSLTPKVFKQIVESYVYVEEQFAREAFGDETLGILSAESLTNYAKYIADLLCINCNQQPIYGIKENPLPYMDLTALRGKTNFFERTVGDYKKLSITDATAKLQVNFTQVC